MKKTWTFTSESVCSGHPDKICDQISDAIVDAVLKKDPQGRVAVETLAANNHLVLAGEVTTSEPIDFSKIAKEQIKRLGYSSPDFNFSDKSPIDSYVHSQSPEIAKGVDKKGAGDQGMMFGFACKETPSFMPMPITLAHALTQAIDTARETKTLAYLHPDGKSQVTVKYLDDQPVGVTKVVIAVPHNENISLARVKDDIYTKIVLPTLKKYNFTVAKDDLIVNGTGVWHRGGPASDCGLTGRKIVVDTYGGYARVGGGAFSGKDPTKVDRSGAYAARYLAKNIVAHGLAEKAEVSLAYFIGATKPLMQEVETFSTETVSQKAIKDFCKKILDTSVEGILDGLMLRRPLYLPTAVYGHFGKKDLPWEKIAKI
ncbi:MAG: methionine adenosyltransferase [Patescibacteria group bacterium]